MGIWGLPKLGVLFGVPIINKDCNILGSILGSPYFAKLPFLNLPKDTSGCKKGFLGGAREDYGGLGETRPNTQAPEPEP